RKRAPAHNPEAAAGVDYDIIDLTMGWERDDVADDATTEASQQGGELDLPDISLLGDDAILREFLNSLNNVVVSDEEASNVAVEGAKGVVLPHKKKRKLIKGDVAKKRSEAIGEESGKDVTDAMAVIPVEMMEERREKPVAVAEKEEHGKKINGKGKVGDGKSGKDVLPPSLHPIIPSSARLAAPQVLSYSTPKWHVLPHHSML
ncbi:hypothetical protein Dimus_005709, partial [Dionaea muscipula]